MDYSVAEDGVSLAVKLVRSGGSYGAVSVDYNLSDGSATAASDYQFASSTVNFVDGETEQTVNLTILDDVMYEGDEIFTITLSNVQGGDGTIGSPASAVITIIENEPVPPAGEIGFEFATEMVNEANGTIPVSVTRTGGSAGEVSVSYQTVDGSAVAGSDYGVAANTLVFADGETSKVINIAIIDNAVYEADETFEVRLSNVQGGATLGQSINIITIVDDEVVPPAGVLSLSQASVSVNETQASLDVTINRSGGSQGAVSVDVSTQDGTAMAGSDYQAFTQTVNFADGEVSKIVNIMLTDDAVYEGDEQFRVNLSGPVGTSLGSVTQQLVTIVENEAAPSAGVLQLSGSSYQEAESGGTVSVTVTRSGGNAGSVSVDLNSSDLTATAGNDYQAVATTLTLVDGQLTDTVVITILDDTSYEGDEDFSLTLSNATGGATIGTLSSATVTIVEDDAMPSTGMVQFSGASYNVSESGGSIDITVTRTGGSFGAASIDYRVTGGSATNGTDYALTDGSLNFADGETSQVFSISITNDTANESNETIELALHNAIHASLGSPATATVTINDDDVVVTSPPVRSTGGGGAITWWLLMLLGLLGMSRRRVTSK